MSSVLLLLSFAAFGSTDFTIGTDTIVISRTDQNVLLYKHKVNNHQNIGDLCDLLACDVETILQTNQADKISTLLEREEILIPISEKILVTEETHKYDKQEYVPVVYEVKPKDNLFRIARHYFFQSLEELMARNQMEDYNLSIGKKLHIGWVSIQNEKLTPPPVVKLPASIAEKNDTMQFHRVIKDESDITNKENEEAADSSSIIIEEPINYLTSKGKGMWDKKVRDNGKLLALHQKAKIGSTIELRNGMLNRTIRAKVIGRIPKNVYPDDISVLVGPTAAKSLGVIDHKFPVEVRYTK